MANEDTKQELMSVQASMSSRFRQISSRQIVILLSFSFAITLFSFNDAVMVYFKPCSSLRYELRLYQSMAHNGEDATVKLYAVLLCKLAEEKIVNLVR